MPSWPVIGRPLPLHATKGIWRDGGRCSSRRVANFTFRPLYTQDRTPGTHWMGGLVGPRGGFWKREKFFPLPRFEPRIGTLTIHIWPYSPFRALASPIRRLNSSLFSSLLLHPLIPRSCNASLWNTSAHLLLGLSTGVVVWKFQFKTFFGILSYSVCQKSIPFPSSQIVVLFVKPVRGISEVFWTQILFRGGVATPHAQPPTWRTRVSLFVRVITFDLSGLGDGILNFWRLNYFFKFWHTLYIKLNNTGTKC